MPTRPIPTQECWRRYTAWIERDKVAEAAGRKLDMDGKCITRAVERLTKLGLIDGLNPAPAGFEIKALSETTDANGKLKSRSTKYQHETGRVQQDLLRDLVGFIKTGQID